MLAFTDPARLAGLAQPALWRAPGTRTAGLIQAVRRILREVGRSAFIAAIWEKIEPRQQAQADRQRRSPTKPRKPPNAAIIVPVTWRQSGATKKKCRLGRQFLEQTPGQIVPLQPMPEMQHRGRVGDRVAVQHDPGKAAQRLAVVECVLDRFIGQPVPLLHK